MEFILIVLLTLLNGAFAMSELALTASRKVRLQNMADAGDKGALAALVLLENPTQFLSSVQVGITSIGMLNGIVGEAAFSDGLAQWLQANLAVSHRVAEVSATALVVTVITFVTILFGELVPKRIGQLYPETVARLVSRPMTWMAIVAKPFVRLLSVCTHAMLRLLRIDTTDTRAVTEAEITASLVEGVDAGIIEQHEHQMVRNVFDLDDRTLPSRWCATYLIWTTVPCRHRVDGVHFHRGTVPRAGQHGRQQRRTFLVPGLPWFTGPGCGVGKCRALVGTGRGSRR